MSIQLEVSHEPLRRASAFQSAIQGLVGYFIRLLQALWSHVTRLYTPAFHGSQLLLDCEKDPRRYVDMHQIHDNLLASFKRREAADAEFEAQVMTLLAPVKNRLAEMVRDTAVPAACDSPAACDQQGAPDLPPAPQIFYGRDLELSALVSRCSQRGKAHIAILGPEGAGKTVLALALLHHPEIGRKFGVRRIFVSCETSASAAGVCLRLASALGLPQVPNKHAVLAALAAFPGDSLIVLDHLEFPPALTELLTDIAAVPRVSLVLTLRGVQRPPGPVYTTPYLVPLGPLPLPAARALFHAISDLPPAAAYGEAPKDVDVDAPPIDVAVPLIDALLQRAGCLPQAIVLLAQHAQYEPLPFLLARCAEEGGV
ncbi:hypothetical protein B0H17DRAFT_374802 [Mycena rosella]|uniref:ORC1/DEAH AAA+ ATPase domain-containing protein n=1 Tax=Mycena rosella TaxID=1033263 RepID=A0AAD7CPB2_MYCRO|nr:hypothetical protein B0H17DRAFT_374802 [Mycena rosella]